MLESGPRFEHHSTVVEQGRRTVKKPCCLNPTCSLQRNVASTRISRYGFYRTAAGKRRRYRCVGCGQTFSSTKGTPYYRLQHRRTTLDTVVTLRVEGVSLSAIARAFPTRRRQVQRQGDHPGPSWTWSVKHQPAVAWRPGESSQQPTWPQIKQTRRCTQLCPPHRPLAEDRRHPRRLVLPALLFIAMPLKVRLVPSATGPR